jgi:phage terminase large subunit-like protein
VKKRAAMRVPYDIWQRDGFLVATPGNMIDYDAIDTKFAQLRGDYDIQTAGVDPASGGRMFAALLCRQYGEQFAHEVGQTFDNLSGPFKQLLRLLKKRVLIHGGNPVLDWQAGNLAAHYKGAMPNGAELADHLDRVPIIPSKQKSPDKIDALAAIIIGLARLFENPIAVGGGGPIIELV